MRDLRLGDGDGWVAGRWGPSPKKNFLLFILDFFSTSLKTSVLVGLCAGGRTTAITETICAGTRSLVGAPPANKDPFYPPVQIVFGVVGPH
jgi:hypothetical protein